MKTYNFKKKIPKNRKIELELPEDAPTGDVELVLVVSPEKERSSESNVQEILNSGLVGIWKDRKDITDSVEYARELRRKAEKRQ